MRHGKWGEGLCGVHGLSGGARHPGGGGGEWESNEDRAKRIKVAAAEKARRKAAEARVEARETVRKKEAAGMKSLSAFFVKKG